MARLSTESKVMGATQLIFTFTTIFFGAIITIWGLSQLGGAISSPVAWDAYYPYIGITVLGIVIIEGLVKWLRIGRLTAGVLTVGIVSILTGTVWPMIVTLSFAIASYLIGQATLSVLKIDREKVPSLISFLIGAGAYGTLAGLLAHFPVNYPGTYGIALILPMVFGWRSIIVEARKCGEYRFQLVEFRWLDLAIVLIGLRHFITALMPLLGHDALAMHLFIPGHLAQRHEWGFDVTTYVWAVMPTLADWIFSVGYMLGGELSTRLINIGCLFVLCWLIRDLVMWAGGNALGARWAILLFLSTPLTYTESSSLFIELVWTSFLVAGTLSIFKVVSRGGEPEIYLPISGLLLGFALAAKAVTFTFLPVILLVMALYYRVWLRLDNARAILVGLAFFLAVGAIPYITAWYITGNPVFPFFNGYFQAPQYPAMNFSAAAFFEKGVSWDTIYQITFESGRYLESKPGAAGFQWMLLLIPAFAMSILARNRKVLMLVIFGLLTIALTFQQTAYLRYVLPSFVILNVAIGVTFAVIFSDESALLRRTLLATGIFAVILNVLFFKSGTHYGNIALKPLISEADRVDYLNQRLPIRNAVDLVNKLNVSNRPVAVFSSPLVAGLSSDALFPSWYNHTFRNLIQKADDVSAVAGMLRDKKVDYIILSNHWGNPEKRLLIKKATKEIAALGSISVRVLREESRYNKELLSEPTFTTYEHWNLANGVKKEVKGIVVRSKEAATQVVSVTPGRRYLLSIDASCLVNSSKGRLQVNWLNAESKFISTNIRVYDCTQKPDLHSMEVFAPGAASKAVIYASGHVMEPLIIHRVSFKE